MEPKKPSEADGKQRVTRNIRSEETEASPGAPLPDDKADPDLRTQTERDQSSDAAGDEPREVMHQAKRDLDGGLVDTDLRGTPGADAERQRELLEREKKRGEAQEKPKRPP
ncbi:MAG: hypothetical protein ABI589_01110 [Burkholderiales bacterium]